MEVVLGKCVAVLLCVSALSSLANGQVKDKPVWPIKVWKTRGEDKSDFQKHLVLAGEALSRHEPALATVHYNNAILVAPKNASLRLVLADHLYNLGDKRGSLYEYRQAIALNKNSISGAIDLCRVGEMMVEDSHPQEARAIFAQAEPYLDKYNKDRIRLTPHRSSTIGQRINANMAAGQEALMRGRLDLARTCFETVLKLDPNYWKTHYFLAKLELRCRNREGAWLAFGEAMKRAKGDEYLAIRDEVRNRRLVRGTSSIKMLDGGRDGRYEDKRIKIFPDGTKVETVHIKQLGKDPSEKKTASVGA